MNFMLFATTVLIWGSTWIAIAVQVGDFPLIVSVFYRFAIAAVCFLPVLALTGQLSFPALRHHPFIIAQALCLFSMNFVLLYSAALYIPSGLIAIIFSLSTIYNALNARLFFGESIAPRVLLASLLGLAGLAVIFLPDALGEIGDAAAPSDTFRGVLLAAGGTLLFSWGNMASRRNATHGLPTASTNAWGMAYGALMLIVLIFATATPIMAPPDLTYTLALLYLAIFGSIIGFTTYLLLVVRVGSSRAAYATVLFPIVAITLSALFEGYQITSTTIAGMLLALAGNIVMFSKHKVKHSAANRKYNASKKTA